MSALLAPFAILLVIATIGGVTSAAAYAAANGVRQYCEFGLYMGQWIVGFCFDPSVWWCQEEGRMRAVDVDVFLGPLHVDLRWQWLAERKT